MEKTKKTKVVRLPGRNKYDPFGLPFLQNRNGRIFNGEFDVTDAPKRLKGVQSADDPQITLRDYLVYRPLPKALFKYREVPDVHPQSQDMIDWYQELIKANTYGVVIDGEYYNPLFVYWVNLFVFPVPVVSEDGAEMGDVETSHPFYCNIDRYVLDVLWHAMLQRKYVSFMGGRGIGKSYLWTSIIQWKYQLFKEAHCIVSASTGDHVDEAWDKVTDCLNAIEKNHQALKHKRLSDSSKKLESGEEVYLNDGTKETRGYLSKITKTTYGDDAGSTRGTRPNIQLIEEFAAFPSHPSKGSLKNCLAQSRGSWIIGGSFKKCTVLLSGTGGSVNNDDAKDVFMKPEAYNIYRVDDWGTKNGCGIFIPTHVKRNGTWEKTGCPDIFAAEAETDAEREEFKLDPTQYIKIIQEYPKTLKDVFTREGTNNFDQRKLSEQLTLLETGDHTQIVEPTRGFLEWNREVGTGKITGVRFERNPRGPFEIIEKPMTDRKGQHYKNLYVAGCDSIDMGAADSMVGDKGSKLALLIKKRIPDGSFFSSTSELYVCKYVERSSDVRTDYENVMKALVWYNARAVVEYTRIGIVNYFKEKKATKYLMKRPTVSSATGDGAKTTNSYGVTATPSVIDHQDSKVGEYIIDHCHQIWYKDVLQDLIDYDRDARTEYDLTVSMGLCELADEELMGILAKPVVRETESFEPCGYYIDENGFKQYGVIPKGGEKNELTDAIEQYNDMSRMHVRWVDQDGNPQYNDPETPDDVFLNSIPHLRNTWE